MFTLQFKTKPYPVIQPDGSERMAINYKANVGRSDTNMRPTDHRYFNSDLFPGMLRYAYQSAIGGTRDMPKKWAYIDALPPAVTIDTSKFMATVTVELKFDPRYA